MKKISEFSKTVFIIGAGAHVPYSYPTAIQFTDLLKKLHRDSEKVTSLSDTFLNSTRTGKRDKDKINICRCLKKLQLVEDLKDMSSSNSYDIKLGNELDTFLLEFGQSQVYSIDAYLANYMQRPEENRKDLVPQIGKLLISYFILDYEKQIPVGFHEFNWIQYIINEFLKNRKTMESFFNSPPKFFTFNYDNHFEKSIYYHLLSYHGLSKIDALEKIRKLEIKHVYGHINSIDLVSDEVVYKESLQSLRVIGQERSDETLENLSIDFAACFEAAREVFFLGFGFDELNTNLIFKHCPSKMGNEYYPEFYSTNIGFSVFQQKKLSERSPVKIQFFPDKEVDCLELISKSKPIFEVRKKKSFEIRRI